MRTTFIFRACTSCMGRLRIKGESTLFKSSKFHIISLFLSICQQLKTTQDIKDIKDIKDYKEISF
jgi:hypothetical protein